MGASRAGEGTAGDRAVGTVTTRLRREGTAGGAATGSKGELTRAAEEEEEEVTGVSRGTTAGMAGSRAKRRRR